MNSDRKQLRHVNDRHWINHSLKRNDVVDLSEAIYYATQLPASAAAVW